MIPLTALPQISKNEFTPLDSLTMMTDSSEFKESVVDSIAPEISPAIAENTKELPDTLPKKSINPTGAMWRSLLFPGWGQLYNRKYIKTLIIGGGELGLIYSIYYQDRQYEKAKKAGDQKAADFYREDRNRLAWWLVGAILYSMGDAYVDAQLADFEVSENLSMIITPFNITINIKIP